MLISKTVKTTWNPSNKKWLESKGYIFTKMKDEFEVKVKDLTEGSHIIIQLLCDYCNETIIPRSYKDYIRYKKKSPIDKDCCSKCRGKKTSDNYKLKTDEEIDLILNKRKETTLIKYGVEHHSQSNLCKEKTKNTNLSIFGTTAPLKNKDILNKMQQTVFKRYGVNSVMHIPEVKAKIKITNLERFGVDSYSKTDEYKLKCKNTLLKNWGVENPSQSLEIKEKINITLYKNGTCPTSSQQLKIYNMLIENKNNVELNFPLSRLNLDIALFINEIKINIEYDSWYFHQDSQKDRRRDEFVKSQGWKILRIRSGHKLPTLEQLENSINKLINSDRTFTQIILDDWKEVEVI